MGKCDVCKTMPNSLDELKPYQVDREQRNIDYIPGHNSKDDYWKLCSNCWHKQKSMDDFMYDTLKIQYPAISWEDPLGKNSKPVNNIIINNYISNNYNNIQNEIINDNKHITYNTSNYNIQSFKDFEENIDVIMRKKGKDLDAKNRADIEKVKQKENKFQEKLVNKQKAHDDRILAEIHNKKLEKQQKLKEAKEQYPDVDEDEFEKCIKCDSYKPFDEFKNSKGNFRFKYICTDCISCKADQESMYRKAHSITCECGISYVCSSEKCKQKHEESDKHKKHLGCILKFNGSKYNIKQLRQICLENKICNSSRMSKTNIVAELNKLQNVIIPVLKD
jgi:hypothetical protein